MCFRSRASLLALLLCTCGCLTRGQPRNQRLAQVDFGKPRVTPRQQTGLAGITGPAAVKQGEIQLASAETWGNSPPMPVSIGGETIDGDTPSLTDGIRLALMQNPDLVALRESESVGLEIGRAHV